MSVIGKIKTLFSDKEKTEALFPRTKVSAISDDNGTGLDAILESLGDKSDLIAHISNKSNPHGVTAEALGVNVTAIENNAKKYTDDKINDMVGDSTVSNQIANAAYKHPTYTAITGKPTANQTPSFGGTATVSQITSDTSGHVTGAIDRTITVPSTLSNGTGTAGLIKTSSTVNSNSGYTACPVINGVPYYKDTDTKYSLSSFGVNASAAELNYTDGVTSNIQTQLNGKAPTNHVHNELNVATTGGKVALYYDDTTKKNHWFKPDITYPTTQKINLGSTTSRTWDNLYVNDGVYVNGTACSLDGHSHEDIEEDIEYHLQYLRDLDSAIQTKVDNTIRVNGWRLTDNVALTATDVGAVPATTKVNKKALSGDVTLTASDVGAAASSHNHSASNITSGTLPIERGGTGATTARVAEYNILGGIDESLTETNGNTPIVCRMLNPSTSNGVLFYRKASNIADYIRSTITPSGIGAAESSHTHTNFGSGTNKMYIASANGNVYPSTTETQQLGLNANKWGAVLCKSVTQSSDERIKENFSTDMDKYVAMLDLIEPTSYHFKSDADKEDRKRNVGYIAQRVQDALAEVGLEDSDFAALAYDKEEAEGTHTYGLDYSQFIPILHAKIKQVEDKYEQRIADLEKTITEIKAKN